MNRFHRRYCACDRRAATGREDLLSWATGPLFRLEHGFDTMVLVDTDMVEHRRVR